MTIFLLSDSLRFGVIRTAVRQVPVLRIFIQTAEMSMPENVNRNAWQNYIRCIKQIFGWRFPNYASRCFKI